jgi:hypothetical protein
VGKRLVCATAEFPTTTLMKIWSVSSCSHIEGISNTIVTDLIWRSYSREVMKVGAVPEVYGRG